MKKFVVKCLSEADVAFILALAFSFGWKWYDDERSPHPAGQTVKNTDTLYLYFGFKGEGLISRRNTVNKSVPPADVLNSRSQLPTIQNALQKNTALFLGVDPVEFADGKVLCGCRKYKADFVADVLRIAKDIQDVGEQVTYHPNGDISMGGRRISNYMLQAISEKLG